MKTAMQDTSLAVYYRKVVPNISDKQYEVLKIFSQNPGMDFTNMELARELGWSINRVTGRTQELRGEGKYTKHRDNPVLEWNRKRPCHVTKNDSKTMQLNPYWQPGGYKID